jgi:nucleotide-binding universal stress UspA family protein
MDPFRKILLPTDFSDVSARALDVAMTIGSRFDSMITLFHVYALPSAPYMDTYAWPVEDFAAAAQRALDEALAGACGRYPRMNAVLASGQAWDKIVDFVRELGFDLIVMGTHGRRGVSRWLLGSVAEKVVRLSPVPVLTVSADRG